MFDVAQDEDINAKVLVVYCLQNLFVSKIQKLVCAFVDFSINFTDSNQTQRSYILFDEYNTTLLCFILHSM